MRRVIWYVATEEEREELLLIEIFVYTGRGLFLQEEEKGLE
jgi:hypothetical protein